MNQYLFALLVSLLTLNLWAQNDLRVADDPLVEAQLRAQTKQLNQFIRRFNGEEDRSGKRLYDKDKGYRTASLRADYLQYLFDNSNVTITPESKTRFLAHVNGNQPKFIDSHNHNWFAEVKCSFDYRGTAQELVLYLRFEQKDLGWHWVLSGVYFRPYEQLFARPSIPGGEILHPMSHEIDFMPLHKVFQKPKNIVGYTPKDFRPDYLSIFAADVLSGTLRFRSIEQLKYHFFQIDSYYFQISEFIRDGLNSGWLISNLVEIPENEKEQFIKLIRHENF